MFACAANDWLKLLSSCKRHIYIWWRIIEKSLAITRVCAYVKSPLYTTYIYWFGTFCVVDVENTCEMRIAQLRSPQKHHPACMPLWNSWNGTFIEFKSIIHVSVATERKKKANQRSEQLTKDDEEQKPNCS